MGIYGKYALSRGLTYEEIEAKINAGETYVIRLKSDGRTNLPPEEMHHIEIEDGIRGTLSMPENNQDVVILKANGIPTYHFCTCDLTTTLCARLMWCAARNGCRRFLFMWSCLRRSALKAGFLHTAQLMKIDEETGQKRKLSKRKDPELSLVITETKAITLQL